MKRKSTGKRQRFEIFKRDSFTCQYCGRTPPSVILEVDHIVPVSKGGDNEDTNLITACFDCNHGKAAKSLDQIPASLKTQIQEQKDRKSQVDEYNRFLLKLRKNGDEEIHNLGLYWYNKYKEAQDGFVFGPGRIPSIRRFLKSLPSVFLMDAMDKAFSIVPSNGDYDESTFKYFCGICWKNIKENQHG